MIYGSIIQRSLSYLILKIVKIVSVAFLIRLLQASSGLTSDELMNTLVY